MLHQIVITCIIAAVAGGPPEPPQKKHYCAGPVSLKAFRPQTPIDEWHEEEHSVLRAPLEVDVIAMRVRRRTRLCPDSFTGMFGTHCTRTDTHVDLSADDLKFSSGSGMCRIGKTCNIDTCNGDHAEECSAVARTELTAPRPLQWGSNELKMVRYSCVQEWGCELRKFKAAPHGKEDYSGFKLRGLAGEEVAVTDFQKGGDGWHYMMTPYEVKESTENLKCLGVKDSKICRYQTHPEEMMLVTGSGGRERNVILKPTTSGDDGWGDLSGPTTTDELKHILSKVIFADLKDKHNILYLLDKIAILESQIIAIAMGRGEEALSLALGSSYEVVGSKGMQVICPTDPGSWGNDNASAVVNLLDPSHLMLETISTIPVIDQSLASEIYEGTYEEEIAINDNKPSTAGNPWSSISVTGLTRDLFYLIGSTCGVICMILRLVK